MSTRFEKWNPSTTHEEYEEHGGEEGWNGVGRREYDVPPMIPSMYPIPEYRPSTPQSDTQPEMVDTVKTYTRPFFREPKIRVEEKRREEKGGGYVRWEGGSWTT